MTRVDIKICGLTTPATLEAALSSGATHIGFMHVSKSPRYVAADQLAGLALRVPPSVSRVGVFVDPDDNLLDAAIAAGGLQVLQLHGREEPRRVAEIALRTGLQVWKVVSVKTKADLDAGSAFRSAAHFLLYDARTPDGAALPGGMGMRFDWSLLAGHRPPLPWGMSGGLDAGNVREAIRTTGTALVDVSSGVESAPGVKDVDKIAAFCKAVSLC
jgi:phosphoribosylanthranilate isomerase